MKHYTRRNLMKSGVAITSGLYLTQNKIALGDPVKEPHFYLQLYYRDGIDSSYLFDGRPLSFTQAGKIQNYLGSDPTPWVGKNGQSCLASSLVTPLRSYKDNFSVINGVFNPARDDGHDQNRNFIFTGNSFGGESFFPYLKDESSPRSLLDFLVSGRIAVPFTNGASSIALKSNSLSAFAGVARSNASSSLMDPSLQFLKNRIKFASNGRGKFSEGVRNMSTGLEGSYSVGTKFGGLTLENHEGDSRILKELKVAHKLFVSGITNCVVISDDSNSNSLIELDTHTVDTASEQPKTYAAMVAEIAETFQFLKNTVFDEAKGLSLLDVTTIMISSEFSRTNYQVGNSMEKTGTDHNSLSNMILLGGKGIVGGQVIGATDLDSLDNLGNYQKVSKVHFEFDPDLIKRMGKPFNFQTMQTFEAGEDYNADQYLTMASVVNTLLKLYGCDESKYWLNVRNGNKAKILAGLLK